MNYKVVTNLLLIVWYSTKKHGICWFCEVQSYKIVTKSKKILQNQFFIGQKLLSGN